MSDIEKVKKSHISSPPNDGLDDTDDVLFDASKELFKGLDEESVSVLAVLAKHGICNEYQIGKKGSSPPTNYLLDRYVAWRRIHTYSDYPYYSGLKDLRMVFQRDGSRFRTGKIIHNYGITLKGLMACLQKESVKFEECYPILQLCNAVSRWSPNNPSLVQSFLQCVKYNLALFMYSHKVHGFILTHHKEIVTLFLSWNKSNPLVRGEFGDLDSTLTEEEKDKIRKLQLKLISSEIVFASIMRQLFKMRDGDFYVVSDCDPYPFEPWRMQLPWIYLQDGPAKIEAIQLQSDQQFQPNLSYEPSSSLATSSLDYDEAGKKARKILKVGNFKPDTRRLNLVWQGDFYNFEKIEKEREEWLGIFAREVEEKVLTEKKNKNLSDDEYHELYNKTLLERIKKEKGLLHFDEEDISALEEKLSSW